MASENALFQLGTCEVSDLAKEMLDKLGVDPASLFTRHQSGDWGEVPEWRINGNNRMIQKDQDSNAILSRYDLSDDVEIVIVTSMTRDRTRLQLREEYETVAVSSAEGYAIWSREYDAGNYISQYEEMVVHPVLETLGSVADVVDIGTGTGRYALYFAEYCTRVVGVDGSPEMLSKAREKAQKKGFDNVKWLQGILGSGQLPLHSNSFDLLMSALMLNHVEDLNVAMSECARVVRPGGTLIFTAFHPAAVLYFGWGAWFETPDRWYNIFTAQHTREDYIDAFEQAGCELNEVYDVASGGSDYGDVSKEAVLAKGTPPRCLILVGKKL